jgi:hypothetical protein
VFEKAATMLMIPIKKMKQFLKDSDKQTSLTVQSLLDYSNETMTARISALLPWMKGTLTLTGTSSSNNDNGNDLAKERVPYAWTTHDFKDKGVDVNLDGEWDGNLCCGSTNRSFERNCGNIATIEDDNDDHEILRKFATDDDRLAYVEAHHENS